MSRFGPFVNGHCKNGHIRTEKNTGWKTIKRNGKAYFSPCCKMCQAAWQQKRYATNTEYRERKKQYERDRRQKVKSDVVQDAR